MKRKRRLLSILFREWQGQRANKICTIEPDEVLKDEDIGSDVQELTESIENKNANESKLPAAGKKR